MLSLDHPGILLAALPVVLLLLAMAPGPVEPDGAVRRRLSLSIRFVILGLLAVALAGPSRLREESQPSTTVFVLDVSESVTDRQLEAAAAAIERMSAQLASGGGRSALVVFAGRAAVARGAEAAPIRVEGAVREAVFHRREEAALREAAEQGRAADEALARVRRARAEIDPLRTAAAQGLLLAQTLHQAGGANRTLLITDGADAGAPSLSPAETAVRLPADAAPDVALRDLRAPLAVRAGDPFDVEVDVWCAASAEIAVTLTVDGLPALEGPDRYRLAAGPSTIRLRNLQSARPFAQGTRRLRAVVSSASDLEPRNNAASAVVTVVGRPKVLVVEGRAGSGEPLSKLLATQGLDSDRGGLDRFNQALDDLDEWSAVVLSGVQPDALSKPALKSLTAYVENGGGLLFAASPDLAEPGHPADPALASILPVELVPPGESPSPAPTPGPTPSPAPTPDPPSPSPTPGARVEPRRVLAPPIALLLVLDKSGSMSGDPIALCKEAAIAAADTLSERDFVGVIGFDAAAHEVLPFTEANRTEYIRTQLLKLFAAGGTDLFPALKRAHRMFREDPRGRAAGVRHVILLSDGVTPDNPAFEKTVRDMKEDGIVVTTVCVVSPDGFRDALLRRIAEWGGGRYLFADSFKAVPKIFTDETRAVVKETIRATEEKIARDPPVVPSPSPSISPSPSPAPSPSPVPRVSPAPTVRRTAAFKDDHEILKGIDRKTPPPPVAGAAAAKAKPGAAVPIELSDRTPLLAVGRAGLGRTAAWTSDVGGPWSAGWETWDPVTKLFAQLMRHLSNAVEDVSLASAVRVVRRGDRIDLWMPEDVEVHEVSPRRGRLAAGPGPDGSRHAVLPLEAGAAHQLTVIRRRGGQTESLPAEFALTGPPEVAPPPDRPAPFAGWNAPPRPWDELARLAPPATMPASAREPLAGWCLLAALLLLPVDVAIRRLRA